MKETVQKIVFEELFKREQIFNVGSWAPINTLRLAARKIEGKVLWNTRAKPLFLLYGLVRFLRPDVVIETGIGKGLSSELILGALFRNDKGILYSIESGENQEVLQGEEPGQGVQKSFASRWVKIFGKSEEELPELLEYLTRNKRFVDLFHHDSDHSYRIQNMELFMVGHYLSPQGIMCFHDYKVTKSFTVEKDIRFKFEKWNGVNFYTVERSKYAYNI